MRVAAVRPEITGVHSLDLVFREPGSGYAFLPGQFNMLGLPGIGECAISIAADPADWRADAGRSAQEPRHLRHTFRAVGNVTHPLARLRPGDELILRGPFGTAWPLDALHDRNLVIAAGGLGLASMRATILHVLHRRGDYGSVAILHGAKLPADLLYTADHPAWREAGLDVRTIVDRAAPVATGSAADDAAGATDTSTVSAGPAAVPPWTGRVGLVPDLFDSLEPAADRVTLLCCGPEPMMAAVVTRARDAGIAPEDIWLSLERNMACAAGFCGLCQFGPAFVCRDGPVFRHDRIAPFLAVRHL
jgi:NAD(P)H-flavin reductase